MTIARRFARHRAAAGLLGLALTFLPVPGTAAAADADPLAGFELPREWVKRFWAEPGTRAALALDPKSLAALVPTQAGLRHCRCPECPAAEADDPLKWSADKPDKLTCRRCRAEFPNDKAPAKSDGKIPEEVVEVLPHVFHHYPYHAVEAERQAIPDERLYLAAKRDYEAREYLSKLALYAAVRGRGEPPWSDGPDYARVACILILRFAQVYPAYATHIDQPGRPKYFQPANLPPPYQRGYRTAKWDWSGCLDVPLNLVIAYAIVRDDPAMAEAGRLLDAPRPKATIERDLFRSAARFVLRQPEEYGEPSLRAYRGLLAVGRLLDDRVLTDAAATRLAGFAERAFTHDGLWRGADLAAHRRIVGQLDGWIARLLPAEVAGLPMLSLARSAGGAALVDAGVPDVQLASWPAPEPRVAPSRGPAFLGGAGLARLGVGRGADALDVELRGFGNLGAPHSNRLAIRLAVAGRTVLGDLDDLPPSPGGFEQATASHDAVLIDGLNQRETPILARVPTPGANCLFFAADPDFQVVAMDDPRAYPRSATRYRQTLIAASGATSRYAVGVFEVTGGLQHDQLFHAAPGSPARWQPSLPMMRGPATLLPSSITFVPEARAEDGRWFVQAMGEFTRLSRGAIDRPATARLQSPGAPGVRLHVLPESPLVAFTGTSPDPSASAAEPGRAALVLHRRSADGATLATRFVTVFEPVGAGAPPLVRVGRVASPPDAVVLALMTADGPEDLVVNLNPGTRIDVRVADGRTLATDGLAVRATRQGLTLAGGTMASLGELQARLRPASGTIRGAIRQPSAEGRGLFEVEGTLPDPAALAGRTLLVRHGDGSVRGWTLVRVEPTGQAEPPAAARLVVREEPGFRLDPASGAAGYYQFPRVTIPGPHTFRISQIARGGRRLD